MNRTKLTFGQALRQELRNQFGPSWASSATLLAVVLVAGGVAVFAGVSTLSIAGGLADSGTRTARR